MTFKNLQDDLIAEVELILKDIQTKNAAGDTVVGVKGFAHQLPQGASFVDEESPYVPYFIVRFGTGNTADDNDWWHVATDILFGVYDSEVEKGHEHLLVMIQRVVNRFVEDPLLNRTYRAEQDIQFAISDADIYPLYFGGVSIKFSVPKIGRREPDYV